MFCMFKDRVMAWKYGIQEELTQTGDKWIIKDKSFLDIVGLGKVILGREANNFKWNFEKDWFFKAIIHA